MSQTAYQMRTKELSQEYAHYQLGIPKPKGRQCGEFWLHPFEKTQQNSRSVLESHTQVVDVFKSDPKVTNNQISTLISSFLVAKRAETKRSAQVTSIGTGVEKWKTLSNTSWTSIRGVCLPIHNTCGIVSVVTIITQLRC